MSCIGFGMWRVVSSSGPFLVSSKPRPDVVDLTGGDKRVGPSAYNDHSLFMAQTSVGLSVRDSCRCTFGRIPVRTDGLAISGDHRGIVSQLTWLSSWSVEISSSPIVSRVAVVQECRIWLTRFATTFDSLVSCMLWPFGIARRSSAAAVEAGKPSSVDSFKSSHGGAVRLGIVVE